MAKRKFQYPVISFDVLDGDTIAVVLDQGFACTISQHCRLYGIDTPEHGTEAGQWVTKVLEERLKACPVNALTSESVAQDKFCGRFVGILRIGDESINDWLLEHRLGKRYLGKKKEPWTDAELDEIVQRCQSELLTDQKTV